MCLDILATILLIVGLTCATVAGLFLLPKILVTQEELDLLANIPVEPSTTHMTGEESGVTRNVALTDIVSLKRYRSAYLEARREELRKGILGLRLIVAAFVLQVIGTLCMLIG